MRMLLAAGGTGGHIWPAIAFGRWVGDVHPEVELSYMCGARPMELEIYRSIGIEPLVIGATGSPLGAPRGQSIRRWLQIFSSCVRAWRLMGAMAPDVCVLFGGYVSAPALAASLIRGVRAVVHEQNACAGRVTRLAAFLRIRVASGWNDCAPLKAWRFLCVGVPIGRFDKFGREEAWGALGLPAPSPQGPVVVVMTGSLGSGGLTKTIAELASREPFKSCSFLAVDPGVSAPTAESENFIRIPRSWDASPMYSIADALIVRGGASTLAEVVSMGIPAIVAPWRGASDDHQMRNAQIASKSGKILIWDEGSENLNNLSDKIHNHDIFRGSKAKEADKKMYNTAGNACELLWNYVAGHV